ncbi:MAG TPA: ABC transporter permease [Flavisolibacter sp.]|nr:ABC transporter permease [Flavisolibacter sp.]
MLKSYIKVAWRNLMNNKMFSFINIFGLSIGLTCCLLITLYINSELSYDKYQKNAANLYQVGTVFVKGEKEHRTANTPSPMGSAMKQEFPEIMESTRLLGLFVEDKTLIRYASNDLATPKSFYEDKGYMTDPGFFSMFTYNFIEGNPASALTRPNCVVLSQEIAQKLFGNRPALNKIIHISSNTNGEYDYTVTGVFNNHGSLSHIDGRFFLSMNGGNMEKYIKKQATDMATNNMFFTYLLVKPGINVKALERKFPAFIEKYAGKDLRAMGFYKKQFLLNIRDIHLRANMRDDVTPVGSMTYIYILSSIALFSLLIACINFMNLSTARSAKRSSEVGIRKVLGAEKKSLISQFLGESVLMAFIAFVFAMIFTLLLLPLFNKVSGKSLALSFQKDVWILISFFLLSFITGLLAGIYPAFYLSSFKPIKVLKGKFSNSLAAVSFRKALVILQFVISIILIVASVVINRQMNYMQSTDLGFIKDQQLVIPLRSATAKEIYPAFKNEVIKKPGVQLAGASLYYPGIFNPSDESMHSEGQSINEAPIIRTNWIDESFLQTIGIHPLAGRLFSKDFPADTNNNVIVNKAAIIKLGFKSPQEAIGKKIFREYDGKSYGSEIIGVVKDFHFQDLHVPIDPYGFYLNNEPKYNYLVVHMNASNVEGLLRSIKDSWHKLNANEPFEYSFLDEDFQKNYAGDERLAAIVGYFTFIAIMISCLGLFGLATFNTEQRIKEIGVRKVLGASIKNIILLVSKDFLKLVTIALIIGCPVAWFVMNKWLQNFAYKVAISWQVFLVTCSLALIITFFTISFQAIRAAIANPVKSLRAE